MEDHAALTYLAEAFPQTFVLEKYQPHRPLKVGIAADILARCPELARYKLGRALGVYTGRVMYLQGMVAGTARIDLDGNPAGEVSPADAEHAAAKLAGILAARKAGRVAAKAERRPTAPAPVPAPVAAPTPSSVKVVPLMPERPVLRLPAFRTAAR